MIIQIALSLICLALILYTLYHGRQLFPWRLPFIAILIAGIVVVWKPDYATQIANYFGVGRGADLLLYLLIMANLIIIVNIHNKFHEVNSNITEIVRKISILEKEISKTKKG